MGSGWLLAEAAADCLHAGAGQARCIVRSAGAERGRQCRATAQRWLIGNPWSTIVTGALQSFTSVAVCSLCRWLEQSEQHWGTHNPLAEACIMNGKA